MEACFVNLLEPGDTAIVGANGVFGDRMCEVARRCGAEVVRVEAEWGQPLDPQRLLDAQRAAPARARRRGGARGDVDRRRERRRAARRAPATPTRCSCVDTVTSLGGIPVEIDGWGVDAALLGHAEVPRRAAGSVAGHVLGPGRRPRRSTARSPPQSWYLDLSLIANYVDGAGRVYHHTAPVSMVFALHAALGALLDEGLEAAWARHRAVGTRLQARAARARVPPGRAPTATGSPSSPPRGCPTAPTTPTLRKALLDTYGIEVGGGLGEFAGKAWRIGLMGHSARERSVTDAARRAPRAARLTLGAIAGGAGARSMCSR